MLIINRSKGFTLIEFVATIVILSIATVSVLTIIAFTSQHYLYFDKVSVAVKIADVIMSDLNKRTLEIFPCPAQENTKQHDLCYYQNFKKKNFNDFFPNISANPFPDYRIWVTLSPLPEQPQLVLVGVWVKHSKIGSFKIDMIKAPTHG